ncbi:MAG: ABC transporter ATP-binding protein [Nitrososphaerota archaeon]
MARLKLVGLSKRFGKQEAVKNLTLVVEDGRMACLLGPSGCGKTTTLRMVAGLEKPDSGDIYIGDRRVNDLPPYERNISMVFQFYAIYPGMTVHDNLAFPLRQMKVPKNEIDRRVKEIADILRISHILKEDAIKLPAGEKQRIALGRALIKEPEILLLDEPLTNLDARLRAVMRKELKRLHLKLKTTTLYVTHDQVEAMTLADMIGVMNLGVLQQYGPPHELYNKPANIFVAGFLGTPPMNFLDFTYIKNGEKYFDFGDFKITKSELVNMLPSTIESDELVLGIRPTDVSLVNYPQESDTYGWEIKVVEPVGDKCILFMSLGDKSIRAVVPATMTGIKAGNVVGIRFRRDSVHIFDKKTGNAIL